MKIHFNMECGAFQSSTQPIDFHDKKEEWNRNKHQKFKKWEASKLELETTLKYVCFFMPIKSICKRQTPINCFKIPQSSGNNLAISDATTCPEIKAGGTPGPGTVNWPV